MFSFILISWTETFTRFYFQPRRMQAIKDTSYLTQETEITRLARMSVSMCCIARGMVDFIFICNSNKTQILCTDFLSTCFWDVTTRFVLFLPLLIALGFTAHELAKTDFERNEPPFWVEGTILTKEVHSVDLLEKASGHMTPNPFQVSRCSRWDCNRQACDGFNLHPEQPLRNVTRMLFFSVHICWFVCVVCICVRPVCVCVQVHICVCVFGVCIRVLLCMCVFVCVRPVGV